MQSNRSSSKSKRTRYRQWLVMLLLVLQFGFVNAEPLWMAAAEVEHHHLFENSDFAAQFQISDHHQDGAHHCDMCHGHSAHFAVLPAASTSNKLLLKTAIVLLPSAPYASLSPNSIYRPPIFSV